jgi:hypothetical protein
MVFNAARRILKFVAPEFRAIATPMLEGTSFVIDLRLNTVEVPERAATRAAGMLVFAAGILRLRGQDCYKTVFAEIPRDLSDESVVKLCAAQHEVADQEAFEWAKPMMKEYFPVISDNQAETLVDHRWDYARWHAYFSDPTVSRY